MIFSTCVNQDVWLDNQIIQSFGCSRTQVTSAQFPIHSSCDASVPAAPGVLQYVRSQFPPAASEASCFHAAVEWTPPWGWNAKSVLKLLEWKSWGSSIKRKSLSTQKLLFKNATQTSNSLRQTMYIAR